jgi:hypothetical protein
MLKNAMILVAVGTTALGTAAGLNGLNARQDPLVKACSSGGQSACTVAAARFLEKQPGDDELIAAINALSLRLPGCGQPVREIAAIRILGAAIQSSRMRRHALSRADALERGTCGVEVQAGSSSHTDPFPRRNNGSSGQSSGSSGESTSSGSSGESTSSGSSGESTSSGSSGESTSSGSSGESTSSGSSGESTSSGSSGESTSSGSSGESTSSGSSGESSSGIP